MCKVRTEGTGRWLRRSQARPLEILDAALEAFAAHGYAATRVEDIASRAQVSKGTVYLYFKSKEEIFAALLRSSITTAFGCGAPVEQNDNGATAAQIARLLRTIGMRARSNKLAMLSRILIAEATTFPEFTHLFCEQMLDPLVTRFTRLIEAGQARGEFRQVPAKQVALLAIAPAIFLALRQNIGAASADDTSDSRKFFGLHIDIFLAGLAATSSTAAQLPLRRKPLATRGS